MKKLTANEIEVDFYDGTKAKGKVPFKASTATPMMLSPWSPPPGIQVGVMASGVNLEFSECGPDCDGKDEQHNEVIDGDSWVIRGTFHLHGERLDAVGQT